jgi:hypothetical protein
MEVRRLQNDELYHHGVKGQKWGVRRYQNKDGSLTPEGRKHYDINETTKKGAKIGGAIGLAAGAGVTTAIVASLASFGFPVTAPLVAGYAATYGALYTLAGVQSGGATGAAIGIGRQYVAKKHNAKLGNLEHEKKLRDFNKKWNITGDVLQTNDPFFMYKESPKKGKPIQNQITDMTAQGASISDIAKKTGMTEAQIRRLRDGS